MGRSITPTYRLEIEISGGLATTPMAWTVKSNRLGVLRLPGFGKPTTENIDKWVTEYEESLKPGGVNAHLGIHSVTYAKIVRQSDGMVMSQWIRRKQRPNEPLFKEI